MKGSRPPPCAGFSLTMTGEDQVVMFGGKHPSGESSEARILHLPTMVSQKAIVISIQYSNFLKLCNLVDK